MFKKISLYFQDHPRAELHWWQFVACGIMSVIFRIVNYMGHDVISAHFVAMIVAVMISYIIGAFITQKMLPTIKLVTMPILALAALIFLLSIAFISAPLCLSVLMPICTPTYVLIAHFLSFIGAPFALAIAMIAMSASDYAKDNNISKRYVIFWLMAEFVLIITPVLWYILKHQEQIMAKILYLTLK